MIPLEETGVLLEEITVDTLQAVLDLTVKEDQQDLVASNAVSIAEAHFEQNALFRAVFAHGMPIGFVKFSLDPGKNEYMITRLMIDAKQQGKGYGRAAMEQIIEFVQMLPSAEKLLVQLPSESHPAKGFFKLLNFKDVGTRDDGEIIIVAFS